MFSDWLSIEYTIEEEHIILIMWLFSERWK